MGAPGTFDLNYCTQTILGLTAAEIPMSVIWSGQNGIPIDVDGQTTITGPLDYPAALYPPPMLNIQNATIINQCANELIRQQNPG